MVNMIISAYFLMAGTLALFNTGLSLYGDVLETGDYSVQIQYKGKKFVSFKFGYGDVLWLFVSLLIAGTYGYTKHWILANLFGQAFSISAISLLNLDSFTTGIALLAGLFFYDIFWVFGTDVMVTVATSFDAPVKVVFPKNIFDIDILRTFNLEQQAMLGLGDIVIPGTKLPFLL
jgi:minor histocompatibility antigen H13